MSKSIVKRGSKALDNPVTNEVGVAMFYGGLGTVGVIALAAILPGGIFAWAIILMLLGFVLGK